MHQNRLDNTRRQSQSKIKKNVSNICEALNKKQNNCDQKAQAQLLKVGKQRFLLNHKYNTQSDKTQFKTFSWNGPYKVMKVLSHSSYIVRETGTHKIQCVHRMRLCIFIPHENVPDIPVDESQFYTDSDVIDELELFGTEATTQPAAVSFGTDESDHDNQQESFIPLQPETPAPTANEEVVHTKPPPQKSHHEPVVTLPEEISHGPQSELQPSPAEEENQDTPILKVTQPKSNPFSFDVETETPAPVIDPPTPAETITTAPCSRYNLRHNPAPRIYQDNLMLELSNKLALAKFMMKKTAERETKKQLFAHRVVMISETRVLHPIVTPVSASGTQELPHHSPPLR